MTEQFVKRSFDVDVEIARCDGLLPTLEGPVAFAVGDAIVSGMHGERWPITADKLPSLYSAVAPTKMGESGRYRRIPHRVSAKRLDHEFSVQTPNGSMLHGKSGDWLIEYDPENYGIVRDDIFKDSYVPVIDSPAIPCDETTNEKMKWANGMARRRAHVPVVIGVAAAYADDLVGKLLQTLGRSFEHTDWIVVTAAANELVRISFKPARGALEECDRDHPVLSGYTSDASTTARETAIYLLRTCSIVFIAAHELKPPDELLSQLESLKEMLPLETPSAGGKVSVFSLPEPAPQLTISKDSDLTNLASWCDHARRETEVNPWRAATSFIRKHHTEGPLRVHEKGHTTQAREVLSQWARVDLFNRDAARWEKTHQGPAHIAQNSPWALRDAALSALSEPAEPRLDLFMINRTFEAADHLSNEWQQKWHLLRINELKRLALFRWTRPIDWPRPLSLFSLTVFAALFLSFATEFGEGIPALSQIIPEGYTRLPGPLFFVAYSVMLTFGIYRLIFHRARRVESRHQDYRLLAEGLRVQFFWSATAPHGLEMDNTMRSYVADHIPIARRGAMFWVRGALHAIRFAYPPATTVAADHPASAKKEWDSVAPCLIEHQLRYQQDVLISRRRKALHRMNNWSRRWLAVFLILFLLLLTRALTQILMPQLQVQNELLRRLLLSAEFQHYFVIGMVVSLVICLSAREAAEGFGLEAEIRRGESTSAILSSAAKHWSATPVDAEAPQSKGFTTNLSTREVLLFEMGRLLIDDYSDWFNIHRERPAQPIHG